jgi:hypothetical protein
MVKEYKIIKNIRDISEEKKTKTGHYYPFFPFLHGGG